MVTLLALLLAPTPASARQADKCGGALSIGEIAVCSAIADDQEHVFRLNIRRDADTIYPRLIQSSGNPVSGLIAGPDGEYICGASLYALPCRLGAAGRYTVTVSMAWGSGGNSYRLSVESARTPSSCARLENSFFSFASPGQPGTLPFGAAAACYRFDQPVGSVLYLGDPGGSGETGDVRGQILDARFEPLCSIDFATTCTLTQPGPYRVFMAEAYGNQSDYTLKMARISQSTGCPVSRPTRFGDPGGAAATATVSYSGVSCHKVKAPTAGLVAIRIDPDQDVWWTLYDGAGQQVCAEGYPVQRSCLLPSAGDYTLLVHHAKLWDDPVTYQVAVPAFYAGNGCARRTGTSWDLPALLVHQTSRVQTNCQPIRGAAGDRIITYTAPTVYSEVYAWLVDSTGAEVCPDWTGEDGCVLPADGDYRVLSHLTYWGEQGPDATYRMQVRRLSSPVGCPTRGTGPYGATPVPGGIRCRILDVTAPGSYRVKAVDTENHEIYAQVYDSAGLRVCGSPQCTFEAPGRYTMVLVGSQTGSVIDNDREYATVFLPAVPAGCPSVSDDATQIAAHEGQFGGAGQVQCLELSSPAGAKVVELLPDDATGAGRPEVTVVDSTGTWVCDSSYSLRQASCELSGTAPFFAVYSSGGGYPTGPYSMAFVRVDGAPACPVLPRTAEGTTVDTSADRFAACFAIPAGEHADREVFTIRRTAGTGDATMSVFDGTGVRYCRIPPSFDRTFTCQLPAGPATVVLEADGVDATYQLTHRAA
ncbi:hypothetical protein GCM10027575_66780 [Phytohabitans suffuscus]